MTISRVAARSLHELVRPRREKVSPGQHPALPYVGLEHVQAHTTRLLGTVVSTTMRSSANRFYPGDVLYSRLRPYLNKVWCADREGLCSAEFIVIPGNEAIDSGFLRYRLNSPDFLSFASSLNAGDRPRVDFEQISPFTVVLPDSVDAQRRIVAEIEKQFSRLDAGVAALRQVQAKLKRYRAAILKAACEGRLVPTEAELARKDGRAYETGEQLLARVLAERRQNWTGRRKYAQPQASKINDLPSLPEGWTWARLDQLGFAIGGLTKNPKRARLKSRLPYLRVANVYANELRLDEVERIGVDDRELETLRLQTGDLLIVEGNGSKGQIGRVAIWDGSIDPCVHQNHVIKVRPVDTKTSPWILHWLLSPAGRHFVELVASSTSGLFTLSVSKVSDLAIAVPPAREQARIVAELQRRFSVVDALEEAGVSNLQRATRLRQSILDRAFSGRLVNALD